MLFSSAYLNLSYPKLLEVCEQVFDSYQVTEEQVKQIELKTREQSLSKLWFQQ
jgi:hypothetical protein